MSRLRVGLLLALVGSLVLGVVFGWIFYRPYLLHVPEQVITAAQKSFNFIGTGLLLGVVIWIWALLVAWLAPRFRGNAKR
ncbi:hypothetical protein FJ251_08625 [bacterium]|nr:hypothetical protein [bacterium]